MFGWRAGGCESRRVAARRRREPGVRRMRRPDRYPAPVRIADAQPAVMPMLPLPTWTPAPPTATPTAHPTASSGLVAMAAICHAAEHGIAHARPLGRDHTEKRFANRTEVGTMNEWAAD